MKTAMGLWLVKGLLTSHPNRQPSFAAGKDPVDRQSPKQAPTSKTPRTKAKISRGSLKRLTCLPSPGPEGRVPAAQKKGLDSLHSSLTSTPRGQPLAQGGTVVGAISSLSLQCLVVL